MALPTGTGSEILKRTTINNQSNTATAFRWDGLATTGTSSYTVPALHIITVLNIIIAENSGGDEEFKLYGDTGAGSIYLVTRKALPTNDTFVWNDKVVLHPGDKLSINFFAATNIDIWCSFIDQDWT